MRYILIFLVVFFLSLPVFGQSEESIQFETFFQEDESSNSVKEEFQEPVLFPEKQLEPLQDEDAKSTADKLPNSETEARLDQELITEIEEKKLQKLIRKLIMKIWKLHSKNHVISQLLK